MGAAASARLVAIGATWRLTGMAAAGDALVAAVTSGGETERTLAGMLLVQAGNRSVPVVTEAIWNGAATSTGLVDVLASIGTDEARGVLVRVTQARPPAVAPEGRDAAAEALRTLDSMRHRDDGRS